MTFIVILLGGILLFAIVVTVLDGIGRRQRRHAGKSRPAPRATKGWDRQAQGRRRRSSTFTVASAHLDVRRLQIAMDDPLFVRGFERFGGSTTSHGTTASRNSSTRFRRSPGSKRWPHSRPVTKR
jgi:hypothetical protein